MSSNPVIRTASESLFRHTLLEAELRCIYNLKLVGFTLAGAGLIVNMASLVVPNESELYLIGTISALAGCSLLLFCRSLDKQIKRDLARNLTIMTSA